MTRRLNGWEKLRRTTTDIVGICGVVLAVTIATALAAAARTVNPPVIVITAAVAALTTVVVWCRIGCGETRRAVAGVIVAFGLATIAGLASLAVVAAAVAQPWLFMLSGAGAFVVAGVGLVAWATRRLDTLPRRRARRWTWYVATPGCLMLLAVHACAPIGDPQIDAPPVAGRQTWTLPTGSRIAYVRLDGPSPRSPTPVIFLHGGPGTPDMAGDSAYFGELTEDGHTVYVYDQLGSGASSRLNDPGGYSIERDIADLEAIRQRIGASQLVLIGHSYGAHVAAGYLAQHPDRVQAMVLISPEPLDPDDDSPARLTRSLDPQTLLRTYALTAQPRGLLAYGLTQIAPDAAHALAGDAEMDARFDRIYNSTRVALHCPGKGPGPALHGLGAYANSVPQSPSAPPQPDYRPDLRPLPTPTLILKGSCDYLSWSSAEEYHQTLTRSQLLYLHGGHNLYQDRPVEVMDAIRAFLAGAPPPLDPWTARTAPHDHRGPAH